MKSRQTNLLTLVDIINQGIIPTCKIQKEINHEIYAKQKPPYSIQLDVKKKKRKKKTKQNKTQTNVLNLKKVKFE